MTHVDTRHGHRGRASTTAADRWASATRAVPSGTTLQPLLSHPASLSLTTATTAGHFFLHTFGRGLVLFGCGLLLLPGQGFEAQGEQGAGAPGKSQGTAGRLWQEVSFMTPSVSFRSFPRSPQCKDWKKQQWGTLSVHWPKSPAVKPARSKK